MNRIFNAFTPPHSQLQRDMAGAAALAALRAAAREWCIRYKVVSIGAFFGR